MHSRYHLTMELSVIVPVYNAEATLRRCVDSVLASELFGEGLERAELILVNDGSIDGSAALCAEYAAVAGVTLTSSSSTGKNHGVSVARNRGIEAARGTYITFVDSDDYVSADYHPSLLAALDEETGSVLAVTGFTEVSLNAGARETLPGPRRIDAADMPNHIMDLAGRGLLNSVCNKAYRRNVIEKHKIQFEAGRVSAEDLIFNLDYLAATPDVVVVPTAGTYFVANPRSATHRLSARYDALHELDTSVAYRQMLQERFAALHVPHVHIEGYFRKNDLTWFYIMVKNVQRRGTPYSVRQQVRQIRRIMDFAPPRENIQMSQERSKLGLLNRTLYRINSPWLTWLVYRLV